MYEDGGRSWEKFDRCDRCANDEYLVWEGWTGVTDECLGHVLEIIVWIVWVWSGWVMWFEGFGWTCLNIFWKLPRRAEEIEKWRSYVCRDKFLWKITRVHYAVDEESFVGSKVDRASVWNGLSSMLLFLEKIELIKINWLESKI